MNMMRLAALAFSVIPLCGYSYDDDLQAPDATIYVEAHGVRSDFKEFNDGGQENGLRLRIGMLFNEATWGRWHWAAEGGLNQFGESDSLNRTTSPGQGFPVVSQTTTRDISTRLNGFEFGARLYDSEMFYLRGGAFIYSLKEKADITVTQSLSNGSTAISNQTPETDTTTSVSPYVGVGIIYPFIDESAGLLLEYNYYSIDGEPFDNISAGIQFKF